MNDFTMKHLALTPLLLAMLAAGCGHDSPETRIDVALGYEDGLLLDTVDVTLPSGTESAHVAHQLRLIIPDELAGMELPIEVWGRMAGKRTAYGSSSATPKLDATVEAALTLHACSPGCVGDQLTTCSGVPMTCGLGCSEVGDAHCVAPRPSNGVDAMAADPVRGTTTIDSDTMFDVDTGEITGGLVRAAGVGTFGSVGYIQAPAFVSGGAPLGIFVFQNLTVTADATVKFTGTRAVILLVGETANIAGTLDVAANHTTRALPGPGGGTGGTATAAATGCSPGGAGSNTDTFDAGGGGGGGGTRGAAAGLAETVPGGTAGVACLPATLEPLQGGSGGGSGSPGSGAAPATGGGGGGALQITALGSLTVSGTIDAGGSGGEGGPAEVGATSPKGAGAGGGGGAGGAILLESPTVTIDSAAILAANGGAGGGGGNNTMAGTAGDNAHATSSVALGGPGALAGNPGGNGGWVSSLPIVGGGGSTTSNSGGGGGAAGAIVIRGRTRTVNGIITPAPSLLDIQVP